jgi:hypothetical protein
MATNSEIAQMYNPSARVIPQSRAIKMATLS